MDSLDIDAIRKIVESQKPKPLEAITSFAVIIPIIKVGEELHIIFELRAKDMKTQPGEVSFPGGKVEDGESYKEAAIRETMEELNIQRDKIQVMGELDYLISESNMRINSFLANISGVDVDKISPNPGEVDHLFTVPLKFFLENEPNGYYLDIEAKYNKEFPYNLIPNGKDYKFRNKRRTIYFYEYNNYIIWGFTASLMKNFIDKIKNH